MCGSHVEDRLLHRGHVRLLLGAERAERAQRPPDLEVHEQHVGVRLERAQQQPERLARAALVAEVAGEGEARAPVARVVADEPLAQRHEARRARRPRGTPPRSGVEREVRALGRGGDRALEDRGRPARVAAAHRSREAEVGGEDARGRARARSGTPPRRRRAVPRARLLAHLRLQEAEHEAVVRLAQAREAGLDLVGLAPLALLLVRASAARRGRARSSGRRRGPRRRPGPRGRGSPPCGSRCPRHASDVGALGAREVGSREQRAVHLDRALDLAHLAQQVAQDLLHLARSRGARGAPCRAR